MKKNDVQHKDENANRKNRQVEPIGNFQDGLCDRDCNNCPIVLHPNSKRLTKIMNDAYDKFGDEFYHLVQKHCPNLTVCYDCRFDDFCHFEGCEIIGDGQSN